METAPFGKRQKGEIGKNYFYVIIEVKTEQEFLHFLMSS